MKIKKRHIVLATLVLALSTAVFVNWQMSGAESIGMTPTSRELGAVTYVNNNIDSSADEAEVNAEVDFEDSTLSKKQIEYFASCRNDREKAQDEVKNMAIEVLELVDSSDEAKEEAVEQLNKLEDIFLSQNRVETTLKAKGFSECLCVLSNTSCTVIVPQNEMTDNSAVIIKACVDEVADLPFEKISIVSAE